MRTSLFMAAMFAIAVIAGCAEQGANRAGTNTGTSQPYSANRPIDDQNNTGAPAMPAPGTPGTGTNPNPAEPVAPGQGEIPPSPATR